MSHFSNIGFNVNSQEEFVGLCQNVYKKTLKIKASGGTYFQYSDPSGAELWIQENSKKELIGANPYFHGKSRRSVQLTSKHKKEPSELDGFFMCEALSQDDKSGSLYPFAFDVPDMQALPKLEYPYVTKIQLSAFAHAIDLYENEKEFEEQRVVKMSSKSFIPSGLFSSNEGNKTSPDTTGIFVGEVKEAQIKINSLSGKKFYWMLVETFGGEIDIVATISQIAKEPQKGNIVSGKFWLTGRILELPPKEKGFFQKLFG
jgi:hypothetical protein